METGNLEAKAAKLEEILRGMGGFVLAYSGGVDSGFLLAFAVGLPGIRVLAATADSSTYPRREKEQAVDFAASIGARQIIFTSEELEIEGFAQNPPDRCYHCKNELFGKLAAIAGEGGYPWVADGSNVDDLKDYRPGRRAKEKWGVRSPLEEAGLTKGDIRELSRRKGLPAWDRPAMACLASRFPYGDEITRGKLSQVERAEEMIMGLGIPQVRVRHHGDMARIEVAGESFGKVIFLHREEIVFHLKKLGFTFVALDMEEYRVGSMNKTLDNHE